MGIERINGDYVWPRTLCMPVRPPKLVYLDLNHWINLARAFSGHRTGNEYIDVLDFCLKSAKEKSAVFPLSLGIYVEMQKMGNYQKRRDLCQVIEQISQFTVVMPRHLVATHETEAVWDQIIGPNPKPVSDMDYLDNGVCRAVGLVGGFRVMSGDGKDITTEFRQSYIDGPEAFDQKFSEAMLEFERQMIEGPSPEEELGLRGQGYNPEATLVHFEQEARGEAEWARLLDSEPVWRRGRLRDLVSAREILFHINTISKGGCVARGVHSLDDIFSSVEDTRKAFNSMPSFDAAVTLRTSLHKDAKHHWSENDIHDIHALAITLPYCDIVVTDRAMASQAMQSGLADRLNTVVLSCLSELGQHL